MIYELNAPSRKIQAKISLPRSKSISNRLLIIRALSQKPFAIEQLSRAEDVRTMQRLLQSDANILNVGAGGTTMRFLIAYLALQQGERILTGTTRMKQRPIGELVKALRSLGAKIKYLEREGYPPIHITGHSLTGQTLHIDSRVSSQFISALLLIAPHVKNGLTLLISKKPVSAAYIEMTLQLLSVFGIDHTRSENKIIVPEQSYYGHPYTVPHDWSGAAFFYSIAALSDTTDITFPGLTDDPLQGDAQITSIMQSFGVTTEQRPSGTVIRSGDVSTQPFRFDFSAYPDLVPPVVVTCAGLGVNANLQGIDHLQYKESDRLIALQKELQKVGVSFEKKGDSWQCRGKAKAAEPVTINPHNDHRIAMAFAPLVLKLGKLNIESPHVVNKSFPNFWQQLEKTGIQIKSFVQAS